MLEKIKLIRLATHLLVAVVVLMGFYYQKYRPLRQVYQRTTAVNIELRKQIKSKDAVIDAVWVKYSELAGLPRYQIDQHLDRIKIKRGSKLEFVPSAAMKIVDSLKIQEGDSITLNQNISDENYRNHWWQFWRKKRQPP